MSKYLQEISHTVSSILLKEKGIAAVDYHFQENLPSGGANNLKVNVFVDVTPNSTISEIERKGRQELKIFIKKIMEEIN